MSQAPPIIQYVARPGILDLGWGHPSPAALPVEQWSTATEATMATYGWRSLTYGSEAGPGPLLAWLAEHTARTDGRGCDAAETFVTAGASHAIELVTTLLTRPGDLVVVDSPTYHLALRILADRGVELVAAATDDEEGIDPAATAALIAHARRDGRAVPMLYLVPTYANPTGRCLAAGRRTALVELAARTGLVIVEDDTYRELGYEAPAPPSLWSLSQAGEVIRIGSFAKTVAPGLRLGWVNAPPELIRGLASMGYVHSGGGVNHTVAMTMATFGESGAYQRHVDQSRARYAGQRDALVAALREELPELAAPSPAGGWFVWLQLPEHVRASTLLPIAERRGVSFAPGSTFHTDGRGDDHVRLSFSMLNPPDLVEAARRLATAVREHPPRPA